MGRGLGIKERSSLTIANIELLFHEQGLTIPPAKLVGFEKDERDCRKTAFLEADGKGPDARPPKLGTRPQGGESKRSADKSRGMRRT
jgi:hypothetical protein